MFTYIQMQTHEISIFFFFFLQNYSSNLQIHLKEKWNKGNNSAKKSFFRKIEKRLFKSLHKERYLSI